MNQFFKRGKKPRKEIGKYQRSSEEKIISKDARKLLTESGGLEAGGSLFEEQPRKNYSETIFIIEKHGNSSICGYAREPRMDSRNERLIINCQCAITGNQCSYKIEKMRKEHMQRCSIYLDWLNSLTMKISKKDLSEIL
jgi:hypothetical protein